MAKGKYLCELLKDIRYKVAIANGIEYTPQECTYKGDCKGTCPACEAEVRYLEAELMKKKEAGETVCIKCVANVDRLPIELRMQQEEWEGAEIERENNLLRKKMERSSEMLPLMGNPAKSDNFFEKDNMLIDGGMLQAIREERLFTEPAMKEKEKTGAWRVMWGKERERADEIVMGGLDFESIEENNNDAIEIEQLQGKMICEADRKARTFWGRIKQRLEDFLFKDYFDE